LLRVQYKQQYGKGNTKLTRL